MNSDQQEKLSPSENKLIAQRREKLEVIRASGIAYPNDFYRENRAQELIKDFNQLEKDDL